jgi:small subunit ribosomal protein S16
MSLKIRLSRIGAVHKPIYRVVVAETRSRRDGAPVESLGTYSPRAKQNGLTLNVVRADYWVSKGAHVSDTVKTLIKQARNAQPAAVVAPTAAPAEVPATA